MSAASEQDTFVGGKAKGVISSDCPATTVRTKEDLTVYLLHTDCPSLLVKVVGAVCSLKGKPADIT